MSDKKGITVLLEHHTGSKDDGNFYCHSCGKQVAIGFVHSHNPEVVRDYLIASFPLNSGIMESD